MNGEVTRRGFLSLCAALPVLSVPPLAEPLVKVVPLIPREGLRIVRYSMSLAADFMGAIEPNKITILRARPDKPIKPDRLIMSTGGFSLLHLGMNGEPILEGEIPSDFFSSTAYGRMNFSTVTPSEEIVIAAVNRNKVAVPLHVLLMGNALEERS